MGSTAMFPFFSHHLCRIRYRTGIPHSPIRSGLFDKDTSQPAGSRQRLKVARGTRAQHIGHWHRLDRVLTGAGRKISEALETLAIESPLRLDAIEVDELADAR